MIIRITAPHFVAAVVIGHCETVIKTAPILKYMKCWGRSEVHKYCRRKGWTFEEIGEIPKAPLSTNEIYGLTLPSVYK